MEGPQWNDGGKVVDSEGNISLIAEIILRSNCENKEVVIYGDYRITKELIAYARNTNIYKILVRHQKKKEFSFILKMGWVKQREYEMMVIFQKFLLDNLSKPIKYFCCGEEKQILVMENVFD